MQTEDIGLPVIAARNAHGNSQMSDGACDLSIHALLQVHALSASIPPRSGCLITATLEKSFADTSANRATPVLAYSTMTH